MIGDWVLDGYGEPQRIMAIMPNSVMLERFRQTLQQIRPIHLSSAIMEKNFPDYEPGYTIGWWPNDDSTYHVEWQQDLEGNEAILMHVMYVHELQHLLRMVKCNKEIEL